MSVCERGGSRRARGEERQAGDCWSFTCVLFVRGLLLLRARQTLRSTCGPTRGDSEVAMRAKPIAYPFFLSLLKFKRERKKA